MAGLRLNIGCGTEKLEGYQSVDLYVPADYRDDITTMTNFADNSVDEVRSYHILEHLKTDDVPRAMAQMFRILKPGGKWQLEVPDLIWLCQDFLDTPEPQRWGWKLQTIFGMQNHDGEIHRTGFSDEHLAKLLMAAGFVRLEINPYFSSIHNQGVINAIAYKP